MVLPDRIELSTSPLPMECSTTELRQHARTWTPDLENRPKRPDQARPVLATRPPLAQARPSGEIPSNRGKIQSAAARLRRTRSVPIRFPPPPKAPAGP